MVEADLWNGHDHFALPLLDICICSLMIRDWLADAALLCTVILLVLRLVSVAVLWLLYLLLAMLFLPAVGYALLPAVGFALLGSFHPFSPARR